MSEHAMKLTRKGYTDDIEKARAGENDGAGGVRPMLAKSFDDFGQKFKYPGYGQPKLDGIRCEAMVNADGSVSLWSREQKPIVAVPRVARYVEALKLPVGTVLDGELYNHELKDDFETISSCVRKQYEASAEEQELIEYHVYDIARDPTQPKANFGDRAVRLALILGGGNPVIKLVESRLVRDAQELELFRQECVAAGYEGAMARALEAYQEGKRSAFLLKMKVFIDDEFPIVGVYEGKGKMAGLAVFICRAKNGKEFNVKMEGKLEGLRKYIQDPSTWQGKELTVKYFTLTRKNRVPRFPVGKCVRDYE